jgi:hypothetical protein
MAIYLKITDSKEKPKTVGWYFCLRKGIKIIAHFNGDVFDQPCDFWYKAINLR